MKKHEYRRRMKLIYYSLYYSLLHLHNLKDKDRHLLIVKYYFLYDS